MKNHGVRAEDIQELSEMGMTDLKVEGLIRLRNQGITLAFVRKLVDAGYDDLTVDELVKIKIHGMDGLMARRNAS